MGPCPRFSIYFFPNLHGNVYQSRYSSSVMLSGTVYLLKAVMIILGYSKLSIMSKSFSAKICLVNLPLADKHCIFSKQLNLPSIAWSLLGLSVTFIRLLGKKVDQMLKTSHSCGLNYHSWHTESIKISIFLNES